MFAKKTFLALLFLILSFSADLFAEYNGAGMLLYYKNVEEGEVYFIFGYDSQSKTETWGDLGGRCDFETDLSFEHAAARFAHCATNGIFVELEEDLVEEHERGLEFFRLKTLGCSWVKNTRLDYRLFFIELTEDEFDRFTFNYNYLKEYSEFGDEYNRVNNFAVVAGSDLVKAVRAVGWDFRCNVATWCWVGLSNRFAPLVAYDYPGEIRLNRYVVNELKVAIRRGVFGSIMMF